jgi:hypothetical protein
MICVDTKVENKAQLMALLQRIEDETDTKWGTGEPPTTGPAGNVKIWPIMLMYDTRDDGISFYPATGNTTNGTSSNDDFVRALKIKEVKTTKYAVDGHIDAYNTIEEAIRWQKIQEFSSWARKASFGQYVALSDKPLETLPLWLEKHADKIIEFLSDCPKNKNSD